MGIIALLAFPTAIVLAAGSFFMDKDRVAMCVAASYVFCAVPVLISLTDINSRIASGDVSGIMDIYPTMTVMIFAVFAIVTVINVLAYVIRRRN